MKMLINSVRKACSAILGRKVPTQPSARSGVIFHDPASEKPHNLDDPFHDNRVQERIAEAISTAAQMKSEISSPVAKPGTRAPSTDR
jgi:hypothetical protein